MELNEIQISAEQLLVRQSLEQLEFGKVLENIASMTVSTGGREIIELAMPTENAVWLREEHTRIAEIFDLLLKNENFSLEGLSETDVRPLFQKSLIQYAFLQPLELIAVRDVMQLSRRVKNFFQQAEHSPAMKQLSEPLHENRLIEKHISEAIDNLGVVKDSASRELTRIRREIFDTANRLRQRLNKLLSKVKEEDAITDEFITQRDGRFVLPMKTEFKRHIPGIIHGVSNSGATVFLEPAETYDMNNQLSLLYNEEQREIVVILSTLTAELREDAREFLRSAEILSHIDAIRAKALHAAKYGGFKPEITDENEVSLRDVRHPLLVQAKGRSAVIPLSIDFSDETLGHLISGPNAGGKTVALKSIGLNVAMALAGIFPCGVCRTNYRTIFAAIGDNQSIENDVSTFSSQLLKLREILINSSPVSLILVDEICSGTDPQEGSALAVGILEGLLARHTFFVVTTHQSSLKSYALLQKQISNASMEFNTEKMESSYRFLSGVPGNSYAFVLGQKIGLPPAVLSRAREYLGDKHSTLEDSIEVIQKYRQEAESLSFAALKAEREAEGARKQYEEKFADFKAKYSQLIKTAKEEAAEIVLQANKLVENTIREVREAQRPAGELKKEFDEQKQAIERAAKKFAKPKPSDSDVLSQGDAVTMDGSQTPGVIVSLDEENQSAMVEFGAMKFRVPLEQLKRSGNSPKTIKTASVGVKFDALQKLDLRGKYADEATTEIENAIGDALVGNIHQIEIIHGKGTGALRQAIQRYLSGHPAVESYRGGELNEGGAGVTFVILK